MVTAWLIDPGYDLIRGSDPPPTLFLDLDSKNADQRMDFTQIWNTHLIPHTPRPNFFHHIPKMPSTINLLPTTSTHPPTP